jgi:type VI protein secretion system component VasF
MEHLLDDKDITSAELWRAWKERSRQRDKASARRMRRTVALVICVLAVALSLYEFIMR